MSNIEKNILYKNQIYESLKTAKDPQAVISLTNQVDPLNETIEKELQKAEEMIVAIDKKERIGFTQEQSSYYRPFLVNKYNEFIVKFYPSTE